MEYQTQKKNCIFFLLELFCSEFCVFQYGFFCSTFYVKAMVGPNWWYVILSRSPSSSPHVENYRNSLSQKRRKQSHTQKRSSENTDMKVTKIIRNSRHLEERSIIYIYKCKTICKKGKRDLLLTKGGRCDKRRKFEIKKE